MPVKKYSQETRLKIYLCINFAKHFKIFLHLLILGLLNNIKGLFLDYFLLLQGQSEILSAEAG